MFNIPVWGSKQNSELVFSRVDLSFHNRCKIREYEVNSVNLNWDRTQLSNSKIRKIGNDIHKWNLGAQNTSHSNVCLKNLISSYRIFEVDQSHERSRWVLWGRLVLTLFCKRECVPGFERVNYFQVYSIITKCCSKIGYSIEYDTTIYLAYILNAYAHYELCGINLY